MKQVPLGELLAQRVPSVDPAKFSDERFTLWSIPSFDVGRPETAFGSEIGSTKKMVQDGDILLSKIVPHIRRAWIVRSSDTNRQIASGEWIVFRDQRFLPGFVRHFLVTDGFHNRFMATVAGVGGSLLRAQPKEVAKIMIPLPPIDEQRRIVGLLDRAVEIRRRADAARAKARAIIPALFLDTFGDPATNPRGWPMAPLSDAIIRITGGKNIEAGNGTSRYRIMKVSAVTSGIFKPDEAKPAPDDHVPAPEHHVRVGDFLFSRANTSELVGAVAIAHEPPDGLLLPDKIWRIEWDEKRIDPRYAYSLLRSSEIRRIFALIGSGTSDSMKNISQAKLVRVSVPLPPLARQIAFAEQVQCLEALARHLDAAAAKAEAMAAGLSAEVFA